MKVNLKGKKGDKKMAKENKKTERKERKAPTGPRRSVIVMDETGKARKLSAFCKEHDLSVSTVYLRLKKRLADSQDDALILQHTDSVLNAERQINSLKVIALKDGQVARMRYCDAIAANAELILSKHGFKTDDSQEWQPMAEKFEVIANEMVEDTQAEEMAPEAVEPVAEESLVQ